MKLKGILSAVFAISLIGSSAYAAGDVNVKVNGIDVACDTILRDGTTYIPLRAVSEALGANVVWDQSTSTASINMASADEGTLINMVNSVSESVVAIAGNYKPQYLSSEALNYNEGYSFGTGMVIKSSGVILTNAHVVDELENITVIFNNGESYPGAVAYKDDKADLAVVKINKLGLKPVTFGSSSDIVPGKTVVAIGTPLKLSRRNTVTKGIISAVGVEVPDSYFRFTQSDVAINGGNSGGPLFDLNGNVIGVNTAKTAGIAVEGTSYSIPVDTIQFVINRYENSQAPLYPEFNASFTESWEARIGLPTNKGLTVASSSNGVLQAADVLTAVNGVEVHSNIDVHEAVKSTWTGGEINLTYTRNGSEITSAFSPEYK